MWECSGTKSESNPRSSSAGPSTCGAIPSASAFAIMPNLIVRLLDIEIDCVSIGKVVGTSVHGRGVCAGEQKVSRVDGQSDASYCGGCIGCEPRRGVGDDVRMQHPGALERVVVLPAGQQVVPGSVRVAGQHVVNAGPVGHAGVHRSWANGVAPDSLGCQLQRDSPHETEHTVLGGY